MRRHDVSRDEPSVSLAAGTTEARRCPLCADDGPSVYHHDADRTYLRCGRCTLIFLHPDMRPTPMEEVLRYLEHQNDGADERYVNFLRRLADPLLARLQAGARGLDYGCGPAAVMAEIFTSRGFPTKSYDPLFRADEALLEEAYDFVTCSEVVEHAHDPGGLFATFATLLRGAGTLAVMTRFYGHEAPFPTWWYRRDPTHVCFYNEDTMRWIAGTRGWDVEFPAPNVALFLTP